MMWFRRTSVTPFTIGEEDCVFFRVEVQEPVNSKKPKATTEALVNCRRIILKGRIFK